jgi:hypothetical protein
MGIVRMRNANDTEDCVSELLCTGRDQNEWRVLIDRVLPGSPPQCLPGYGFFARQQDGRLQYEYGETEFGPRLAYTILTRSE